MLIFIGDVIALGKKLERSKNKLLSGKRILVTRSRGQASDLVDLLEKKGAEPVEFPTIKIVPPLSFDQLDLAIEDLGKYDWLIFTSANGVHFFFERLKALGRDIRELKETKIAAIGPATARQLEDLSLFVDFVPQEYRAEAVIDAFRMFDVPELNILIPRAEVAREILPQQLREMGANVDVVTAYKTVMDSSKVNEIKNMLLQRKIDIVTFSSSSTVRNFAKLLENLNLAKVMANVTIACIGPITASTARNLGFEVDIEAKEYTVPGLVKAIEEWVRNNR